jgi:hypothetical protein
MIKFSYISLTSIQVGFLINLPALIFGYSIAELYNPLNALLGVFLAGIILFILSMIGYLLIEKYPNQNTVEVINHFFNPMGKKLAQFAFLIPMIGWYCIQLLIITQSLSNLMINKNIIIISIGLIIMLIVFKGIEAISKFSNLCFIPMILTILFAILKIIDIDILVNKWNNMDFFLISILKSSGIAISSMIALVIDNPTFYQYAKTKKDAYISFFLLHVIFFPLVLSIGILFNIFKQGQSLPTFLFGLSNSMVYFLWICLFFLIIGITTNIANLISAAYSLEHLININYKKAVLVIGFLGIVFSIFNLFDNFIHALDLINILTAGIFGLLLINLYLKIRLTEVNKKINTNLLLISFLYGLLSSFELIVLTGFSFIDTFLFTILLTFFMKEFIYEK